MDSLWVSTTSQNPTRICPAVASSCAARNAHRRLRASDPGSSIAFLAGVDRLLEEPAWPGAAGGVPVHEAKVDPLPHELSRAVIRLTPAVSVAPAPVSLFRHRPLDQRVLHRRRETRGSRSRKLPAHGRIRELAALGQSAPPVKTPRYARPRGPRLRETGPQSCKRSHLVRTVSPSPPAYGRTSPP